MRLASLAIQNSTRMQREQAVPKTHATMPILTTIPKASALAAQALRSFQRTSCPVSAQSTTLNQETIALRTLASKSKFSCQPASARTVNYTFTLMPKERHVSKTIVTPQLRSLAQVASVAPVKTSPIQMLMPGNALLTLVILQLSILQRMESVCHVMTIFIQAGKNVFRIIVTQQQKFTIFEESAKPAPSTPMQMPIKNFAS